MTSDTRRKALALLAEVWDASPDVRLGQLMAHLGFLGEAHLGRSLGDLEDDELTAILERHQAELQARSRGAANPALPPPSESVSLSGSPMVVD